MQQHRSVTDGIPVFLSVTDSSVKPELVKCAAPSYLSGVVDRFEVDVRYGNFLACQTDLSLSDILDALLVRTSNPEAYIHPNRLHAFGNNTNNSFGPPS